MNKVADFYLETKGETLTAFKLKSIKDNLVLAMGNDRGEINIYNTNDPSKSQFSLVDPAAASITCMHILPGSSSMVSGSARGLISILDLETGKSIATFAKHVTTITAFHNFFYREGCFVSGSLDTSVRVWDVRQKAEVSTFKGHSQQINTLDVSPDDAWVISGSDDGSVKFWDVAQGKVFQDIRSENNSAVLGLMVNPNDFQIAFGGNDRSVSFYNIETFKLQARTIAGPSAINHLLYDETGLSLYALGSNFLKILSSSSYELIEACEANWKSPSELTFFGGDIWGMGRVASGCRLYKLGLNIEKIDDNKSYKKADTNMIIEDIKAPMTEADELAEIELLHRGHNQIYNSLDDKLKSVSTVINFFFEQGNIQAARIAIEKIYEPKIITDLLNTFLGNKIIDRISIEIGTLLLKKAILLYENKYKFYIKTALKFSKEVLKRFTQEIVSFKSFSQMSKHDLEREERIKKYDAFLAEVDALVKHKIFNKLMAQFQADEIGELSRNMVADYQYILDTMKRAPA
jgi:WD40 repeat protein